MTPQKRRTEISHRGGGISGALPTAAVGCIVLLFCLMFCPVRWLYAQLAKEATVGPEHNYTVSSNDMRSYEIIYESFNKKDYAAYSKAIREKIKERLKNNYTYHFKNGDVNVFFVVKSDGALVDLGVDKETSIKDTELIDIVTRSVKQASPFPHFPKTLPLAKMSFNIKISFKES